MSRPNAELHLRRMKRLYVISLYSVSAFLIGGARERAPPNANDSGTAMIAITDRIAIEEAEIAVTSSARAAPAART
jgi:hypothetical protein